MCMCALMNRSDNENNINDLKCGVVSYIKKKSSHLPIDTEYNT